MQTLSRVYDLGPQKWYEVHITTFIRNWTLTPSRNKNCRRRGILELYVLEVISGVKWRGVSLGLVCGDCGHGASAVTEWSWRSGGLWVLNVAEVNGRVPREVPAASARLKRHLSELEGEVTEVITRVRGRVGGCGRRMVMVPCRPLAGDCGHVCVWGLSVRTRLTHLCLAPGPGPGHCSLSRLLASCHTG